MLPFDNGGDTESSCACFSTQATGLSAETMRVVLERCYNDLRLLYVPNKTLKSEGFFRSNKVRLLYSYPQGLIPVVYLK